MGFSFRGYRQLFKFKIFGNTLTKKLSIFSLVALLTGQILPASQLPVSLAAVPSAVTSINICNEANLLAALAVGGEITFSCSGNITLTTTPLNGISITKDTTLDGSGQNVSLDGGGARGIFSLSTPGLTLTLKNLTIAHAGTHGAINSQSANLNISHTTFANNTTDGSLGGGGALRLSQGNLNITNSLFISNTASSDGGAIFIGFGGVTNIVDSTFTGNSNPGIVGLEGGAIFNGGNLTVRNSTFNVNNSTVNSSFGGAIANDNIGNLTVINSTFFGNGGRHGAAIFSPGPNARIINSTIVANGAAGDDGAAVYAEGSTLNVINSIIANNPPGNCFNFGPVGGHNNLETGPTTTCGTNSLLADPLLGPLADNGGPTQTLALLTGSQAINAADNAICQTAPPDGAGNLDQRGVMRPQGNGCDIGAFELVLNPPALPAPSGLRASTFSPTRLDLSWQDNSTTESGFSLERKTGAGGTYAPVATLPVNTTTFSDNTVTADTTYFYRVQALQSGLVSAFSNEVKATSGATNLVVTVPSDDGSGTVAGSLSRALHQANPGQVITFNLNGGANIIAVSGSLPTSQAGISVDGGSCTTGAGGGPRITLDGSGVSGVVSGLQFNKGVVLKNIRLKGFGGRQLVVQSGGGSLRPACVIASKT